MRNQGLPSAEADGVQSLAVDAPLGQSLDDGPRAVEGSPESLGELRKLGVKVGLSELWFQPQLGPSSAPC